MLLYMSIETFLTEWKRTLFVCAKLSNLIRRMEIALMSLTQGKRFKRNQRL